MFALRSPSFLNTFSRNIFTLNLSASVCCIRSDHLFFLRMLVHLGSLLFLSYCLDVVTYGFVVAWWLGFPVVLDESGDVMCHV